MTWGPLGERRYREVGYAVCKEAICQGEGIETVRKEASLLMV
jgi:hypothetical protein